jgi:hypothetical protein
LPFETTGKIYPPEQACKYWQERTGLKLIGCYNEIEKENKKEIAELLKLDKWTKCERRILESWI